MKYILLLIILGSLYSGCSEPKFIIGKYTAKHFFREIVFFSDSTFEYKTSFKCNKTATGKWSQFGEIVQLQSFIQQDQFSLEYKNEKTRKDKRSSNIKIKINAPKGNEQEYICSPYVNGKFEFQYPDRGSFSFESYIPVDSIYFIVTKHPFILPCLGVGCCYNDIKTEQIYPQLLLGDNLDITINIIDSLFSYQVFKNDELKIKKNAIVIREGKEKYKLYFKKGN